MSQGPLCLGYVSSSIVSKLDPKIPKGSVPNGQSQIANRYAIRWFNCKLKPPKMQHNLHTCLVSSAVMPYQGT